MKREETQMRGLQYTNAWPLHWQGTGLIGNADIFTAVSVTVGPGVSKPAFCIRVLGQILSLPIKALYKAARLPELCPCSTQQQGSAHLRFTGDL